MHTTNGGLISTAVQTEGVPQDLALAIVVMGGVRVGVIPIVRNWIHTCGCCLGMLVEPWVIGSTCLETMDIRHNKTGKGQASEKVRSESCTS